MTRGRNPYFNPHQPREHRYVPSPLRNATMIFKEKKREGWSNQGHLVSGYTTKHALPPSAAISTPPATSRSVSAGTCRAEIAAAAGPSIVHPQTLEMGVAGGSSSSGIAVSSGLALHTRPGFYTGAVALPMRHSGSVSVPHGHDIGSINGFQPNEDEYEEIIRHVDTSRPRGRNPPLLLDFGPRRWMKKRVVWANTRKISLKSRSTMEEVLSNRPQSRLHPSNCIIEARRELWITRREGLPGDISMERTRLDDGAEYEPRGSPARRERDPPLPRYRLLRQDPRKALMIESIFRAKYPDLMEVDPYLD